MFKGFYNLTSGMLTQQRNLNVVGNNLVNISTAGFKQDRYTASTFDEVMYSRVGSLYSGGQEIGQQSYIRATRRYLYGFYPGRYGTYRAESGFLHYRRRYSLP